MQKALDDKFKDVQTKLQEAQESGEATDKEIKALHEAIEKSGNALEEFMNAQAAKRVDSIEKQLNTFLKEKEQEIKDVFNKGAGYVEFVPKAVDTITTESGTDATTPSPLMHTNLGHFNFRDDNPLVAYATVTKTNKPTYAYTELAPKDGNYEFVAEGAEKPQIDFEWINRFAEPYKIAAYEVLTEEAVTDVARLESVAKEYLKKKHDLFKADRLYFGTGLTGQAKGATLYGRTFVAGDMALKVQTPGFMDVINAGITDVYTTHNYVDESPYMPNLALISPINFFLNLVSAKDSQGRPLYPQAGLFNTVTIGGVTIRPWAKIPAGKVFIGDMKRMNVVNYIPFSIRIGWINDQFIHNTFTMLGESRYFQFVKKLDEQAFIYDDIDTIATAIEKP